MASVVGDNIVDFELPMVPLNLENRRRIRWGRALILWLAAAYFIIPIYAALKFSLQNIQGKFSLSPINRDPEPTGPRCRVLPLDAACVRDPGDCVVLDGAHDDLRAHEDAAFSQVHGGCDDPADRHPSHRAYSWGLGGGPLWLKASPYLLALVYVVLAMPFVYRSLDSGLGALDVKTLSKRRAP